MRLHRRVRSLALVASLALAASFVATGVEAGGTGGAEVAWVASAGGADSDEGTSVATTPDGGSIVTGTFAGSATFGAGPDAVTLISEGDIDIFVAKYSPTGKFEWAVSAGGTGPDDAPGIDVLTDGSVVVAGSFVGTATFGVGPGAVTLASAGAQDIFLVRYSPTGVLQWAVRAGGPQIDGAAAVVAGADGAIYVTGTFEAAATFGSGPQEVTLTSAGMNDVFVARYTAAGTPEWARRDGGASLDSATDITAVPLAFGGGVAVSGFFAGTSTFGAGANETTLTSAGSLDGFVARYSPAGANLWAARVGGSGIDVVFSVAATPDGGVAAAGYFDGTATFENGGASPTTTSAGLYDVFVAKLDNGGMWSWASSEGGATIDLATGIAVRPDGGLVVVGMITGTAIFGSGTPASSSLVSAGDFDVFVARYTAAGELVWAVRHGGPGSDAALGVDVSPSGNAVVTGSYNDTVTFPTDPPSTLTTVGLSEMFVLRTGVVPTRVGGADRFATAVALAATRFGPGVPVVHIATGANFPDALVAGPAASASAGPILLTQPNALPAATAAALTALAPGKIIIVGGTGAVSDNVATQLGAYAPIVERISGPNRYATAAQLSQRNFAPGVSDVYIASGQNFADAVGGGAAASQDGAPMLLVGNDQIPAETAAELSRLGPTRIIILGGTGAISTTVETQLAGYAATVVRRAGADRYATSAAISAARWAPGVHTLYLATGGDFPDALAATPTATPVGAAVLLSRRTCIPAVIRAEIERLEPERIVLVGGEGALDTNVMALTTCPP